MELTYFVEHKLYNGTNGGWSYKTELKTTDYDTAVRKLGELVSSFYGKDPYTFGTLTLVDMYGNVKKKENWDNTPKPEPPEPTPEPTE